MFANVHFCRTSGVQLEVLFYSLNVVLGEPFWLQLEVLGSLKNRKQPRTK